LAGAQAITVIKVALDAYVGAAAQVLDYANASVGGFGFSVYSAGLSVSWRTIGNAGLVEGHLLDSITPAEVLTWQIDLSLATNEANLYRRNGTAQAVTLGGNPNSTNTFTAQLLSLFALTGGVSPWPGSLNRVLIYNRALSAGEMQSIERALGLNARILVA
jgi:hypothetical protein